MEHHNTHGPNPGLGLGVFLFNTIWAAMSWGAIAELSVRIGGGLIGCAVGLVTIYWYYLKIKALKEGKDI